MVKFKGIQAYLEGGRKKAWIYRKCYVKGSKQKHAKQKNTVDAKNNA